MNADALAQAPVDLGERTMSRVRWRLMPFLGLLYIVAYLDRVNVGFAKLTMNAAIGIDDATYAFGAGIFFIGYLSVEVPSNLILERVGARRWIARHSGHLGTDFIRHSLRHRAHGFIRCAFSWGSLRPASSLASCST